MLGMQEQLNIMLWSIAAENAWVMPLCFALFGICIGSFLNVVIYRMPRGMSVNEPKRSFCPKCRKEIPWYLNLPVLSWLILRGKSACCGERISIRYWLVEVACGLFFAAVALLLGQGQCWGFYSLIFTCLWGAVMLAVLSIDWEQMIVLPKMTVAAAAMGVLAAATAPWQLFRTTGAENALVYSMLSGLAAFGLLKLIGFLGKLLFGKKRLEYPACVAWQLRQHGEDLELRVGQDRFLWSELFMEAGNRVQLQEAGICTEPDAAKGTLTFTPEHVSTPSGHTIALEEYEQLQGTCRAMAQHREALGSGDAWIALAIGCLCGWQGCCFALAAGSLLGLLWAAIARIGRGEPMPFGPVFIMGAWVYLFYGKSMMEGIFYTP